MLILNLVMIEVVVLPILKNTKSIFFAVLLIKMCVLTINLASQSFFPEEKNGANKFIKAILKVYNYCRKEIKNT